MKEAIIKIGDEVESIEDTYVRTVELLSSMRENGAERIGYVAGIISSEGEEHIERNLLRLARHTEVLRESNDFPVFSSPELFPLPVLIKLGLMDLPKDKRESELRIFYQGLLAEGLITDIFLTPKWDLSVGSILEKEAAEIANIDIHIIEDEVV